MKFLESPDPSPSSSKPVTPPIPLAHMHRVLPDVNLWIGDLHSASDAARLKEEGITSVVSAMRGGNLPKVEGVESLQVLVDDIESADILEHLEGVIEYIREAIKKGGVLVHCVAGMSRSATLVAAYLMAEQSLTVEQAVEAVRTARSCTQPSDTFLYQLKIFENAKYRVTTDDSLTRQYYRDRAATQVLNGAVAPAGGQFAAKFPSSGPSTSGAPPAGASMVGRRRKLRCGSCRRELALKEHVLHPLPQETPPPQEEEPAPLPPAPTFLESPAQASISSSPTVSSPLAKDSTTEESKEALPSAIPPFPPFGACVPVGPPEKLPPPGRLPPDLARARTKSLLAALAGKLETARISSSSSPSSTDPNSPSSIAASPSQLSSLVSPSAAGSPLRRIASDKDATTTTLPATPSILDPDSKCSGYFMETMDWMAPSYASGAVAGKILCPNTRCKAKLGNYDWSGQCCGCKEWITPAFCLHRGKVDDIAY